MTPRATYCSADLARIWPVFATVEPHSIHVILLLRASPRIQTSNPFVDAMCKRFWKV